MVMATARDEASAPVPVLARDLSTSARRELLAGHLFQRACVETGDRREALLGDVIALYVPVARGIAGRYRNRGCELEDLEQTACLELVAAVRRFDPAVGTEFLSYAVPCIRGAVRRHFRDLGWMIRPPRSVQELQPRVRALAGSNVEAVSSHQVAATAAALDVTPTEVLEAMVAVGCFAPASLDAPIAPGAVLGDLLPGTNDPGFAASEARTVLSGVLERLSDRDRRLLRLRFVDELSQVEIGKQTGISQTQVSRRLQWILVRLNEHLTAEVDSTRAMA